MPQLPDLPIVGFQLTNDRTSHLEFNVVSFRLSSESCCSPYSKGEAPEFGKSHAAVGQEATVEEHIHSDVSEWQD